MKWMDHDRNSSHAQWERIQAASFGAMAEVSRKISVTIVFPEDLVKAEKRKRLLESAQRMRLLRDAMEPHGMTVAELLEKGRRER